MNRRPPARRILGAATIAFVALGGIAPLNAQESRGIVDESTARELSRSAWFAGAGAPSADVQTRRFSLPESVVRSLAEAASREGADGDATGSDRIAPIAAWLADRAESGDAPQLAGYRIVETRHTRLGGAGFVGESDLRRGLSRPRLTTGRNAFGLTFAESTVAYDLEATGERTALDRWQRTLEQLSTAAMTRRARIAVAAVVAPKGLRADEATVGASVAVRESYTATRKHLQSLPGAETVGQAVRDVEFGETLAFDWTKPYAYVAAYSERRLGDGALFAAPEVRTLAEGLRVELAIFPASDSGLALIPRCEATALVRPTRRRDVEVAGEVRRIELTERVSKVWQPGVVRLPSEGGLVVLHLPLDVGGAHSVLTLLVRVEETSSQREGVGGVLVAGVSSGEPVVVEAESPVPAGTKLIVVRDERTVGAIRVRAVEGRLLIADLLDGEARRGDQVRR
jgi:hypothetical protein